MYKLKAPETAMAAKIASRMNRMAPSGIRKVNEKALAMERNGAGLAKIAVENDLFVISDEVYERLIYGGEKHVRKN